MAEADVSLKCQVAQAEGLASSLKAELAVFRGEHDWSHEVMTDALHKEFQKEFRRLKEAAMGSARQYDDAQSRCIRLQEEVDANQEKIKLMLTQAEKANARNIKTNHEWELMNGERALFVHEKQNLQAEVKDLTRRIETCQVYIKQDL
jgi:glycyl-tRNA synthetase alpha subunit